MNTKGLSIVLLVAASAAAYAPIGPYGPAPPWIMTSITVDGEVAKIGPYQTHAECEKAIPQVERQEHTTNGQCIFVPLGAHRSVPNPWAMTITMPNGKLMMVVDYPSKATCEQDIPDVEASQGASHGHCDPGIPDTTSLEDLEAQACPSAAPTTQQDWEKRHTALVQVCAGVEIDCGNLSRENVACYNYRLLPPACRAALIDLGCTTRGFAVAAKQAQEDRANNVGHPDCSPDQITISNRIQIGNTKRWNATCKGKVYLCSGRSWAYGIQQSLEVGCLTRVSQRPKILFLEQPMGSSASAGCLTICPK